MPTALIIAIAYFLILSIGTSLFLGKKVKSGSDLVTGSNTLAWCLHCLAADASGRKMVVKGE